ncbi:hypothetical protein DVA67_017285 [Solirubrobacter sp. CPCC 204708]|uniref:Uncharacterized protein n=1 Tax=Solirubrobacter deserti TaxID=2282478 RepID=A0ABT4RD65_9ACTN|nr:hypothetical protein [Solirubrobacter deserti]MBE2317739.1 hypothetical protein [Solirubrobacter deserti]MDA0136484.1 hypothetical protein [Solirubrobacter deserti]
MDRADQWLHCELRDGTAEGGLDALEALEAAGAVTVAEAARWRERFVGSAEPQPVADASERAQRLLATWLDSVPVSARGDEPAVRRFQGALGLLAAAGAADARAWDTALRARAGWPSAAEERALERELNAGATEVDLLAVVPGPPDVRGGHRLLLVLRFADGISVLVEGESDDDWPEWTLTDDARTTYRVSGFGGDAHSSHASFYGAPPATARRLDLSLDGHDDVTFRVDL